MVRLLLLLLGAATITADPVDVDFNDYADRLIGGVSASVEEFPFIVSVTSEFNDGYLKIEKLCGGTIITADWVMTAGHCLKTDCTNCLNGVTLRAGTSYHNKGGVVRVGTQLVQTKYPQHDITLIKVNEPWPLNGMTISLARLPRHGAPIPEHRPATIMGWGEIDMGGAVPDMLMKSQVQLLSYEECLDLYRGTNITINDMEICSFFNPRGKLTHSWLGDSGSPVVADGQVVGIVSSGVASGDFVLPDIHTRVSSYIAWIEQAVGPLP